MSEASTRSARFLRGRRAGPARPLLAVLAAVALAPAADAQEFDVACPTDEERQVVELINQERADRGLAPLALDVRLGAAALRHSGDMADGCFLSHTGSDGTHPGVRVADAGYAYFSGEVAGAGHTSPAQIVAGWMDSPGHHAIIMGAGNTQIGVGHVTRSPCQLQGYSFDVSQFWTANLGRDSAPPFGEAEHCADGAPLDPPGTGPCNDGRDDDGDGLVDFPEDWGCESAEDVSEHPACSDGLDNDGDGRIDFGDDPGCLHEFASSESTACSDGLDNDRDGLVDHPDDPQCRTPSQHSESDVNCGLGAELVVLLPPLLWLRRRRARVSGVQ